MTEINQKTPSSDSIIYKTKFGKLIKVDNLKPEKYVPTCAENLNLDEIPTVKINNEKPLPNQGLYLSMTPREKTFLYSPKDLETPVCYLTKKKKQYYNKLKKSQKKKITDALKEQLPEIERQEKEKQEIRNQALLLQKMKDKEERDKLKALKMEEKIKKQEEKKRIMDRLKKKNKKQIKKDEAENLQNYYTLIEKLNELLEKMKISNYYQKKELKFNLLKLYINNYNPNFLKISEKYLHLLELKIRIDINRYLIKLKKISVEINNLIPEAFKELEKSEIKEDYFKEINFLFIEISFTFKSNLYFFNSKISSLKLDLYKLYNDSDKKSYRYNYVTPKKNKIEKIGFFIENLVIEQLRIKLIELRKNFVNLEDKEYIDSEIKKYKIIIQLLRVQEQLINFNNKYNKLEEKKNKYKFLSVGKINKYKLRNEIRNYEKQLINLENISFIIFNKEKQSEFKELSDNLNDNNKKLLIEKIKKKEFSPKNVSSDILKNLSRNFYKEFPKDSTRRLSRDFTSDFKTQFPMGLPRMRDKTFNEQIQKELARDRQRRVYRDNMSRLSSVPQTSLFRK